VREPKGTRSGIRAPKNRSRRAFLTAKRSMSAKGERDPQGNEKIRQEGILGTLQRHNQETVDRSWTRGSRSQQKKQGMKKIKSDIRASALAAKRQRKTSIPVRESGSQNRPPGDKKNAEGAPPRLARRKPGKQKIRQHELQGWWQTLLRRLPTTRSKRGTPTQYDGEGSRVVLGKNDSPFGGEGRGKTQPILNAARPNPSSQSVKGH